MNKMDLRKIPNEIIITIYNIRGEKRNDCACEGKNIRYFGQEFYDLFNPDAETLLEKEKAETIAKFKEEAKQFIKKMDFSAKEDIDYKSLYTTAKYWFDYYDKKLKAHKNAFSDIEHFVIYGLQDYQDGKPLVYDETILATSPKYIVTKGSVVKVDVSKTTGIISCRTIYTEKEHKEVVDSLINNIYERANAPQENE